MKYLTNPLQPALQLLVEFAGWPHWNSYWAVFMEAQNKLIAKHTSYKLSRPIISIQKFISKKNKEMAVMLWLTLLCSCTHPRWGEGLECMDRIGWDNHWPNLFPSRLFIGPSTFLLGSRKLFWRARPSLVYNWTLFYINRENSLGFKSYISLERYSVRLSWKLHHQQSWGKIDQKCIGWKTNFLP